MTKGKISILVLGAIIIVALLAILILAPTPVGDTNIDTASSTEQTGTTTETELVDIGGGIMVKVPVGGEVGNITLENEDLVNTTISKPDLDREVRIPEVFGDEGRKIMATNIANAVTTVQSDPTSFDAWLTLGNLRKQIQDYEGAIEIYEYLNVIVPDNDTAHLNAASTYHLNLQEFEKAEENFEIAIEKNVTNVLAYIGFHELYKYSYKQETARAEEVLLKGIEMTNDPNLYVALGLYYIDQGRQSDAREALQKARAEAENRPTASSLLPQIDALLEDL